LLAFRFSGGFAADLASAAAKGKPAGCSDLRDKATAAMNRLAATSDQWASGSNRQQAQKEAPAGLRQAAMNWIVQIGKGLVQALTDPYRPELHYMRGPGPKWRAKNGPGSARPGQA
jgi:hypothetical protein